MYILLGFPSVIDLPHKEAEEAEQRVHESDIVGDARDDCLLTVRTHRLHRRGLKHFPLQDSHSGRRSWGGQDRCCVTSHVDKVTGTRTHLSWHWMRKVTGRRWVGTTCQRKKNFTYWAANEFRYTLTSRSCSWVKFCVNLRVLMFCVESTLPGGG